MSGLMIAVVGILTLLALPALVVLFIGLFVTGLGAVVYILVKIGIVAAVVLAVAVLVWLLECILS